MSLIDSELQDGLREMEANQANDGDTPSFTWQSNEWPCSLNTNKAGSAFVVGEKVVFYDFALRVRLDAVAEDGVLTFSAVTQPVSGNTVIVDDTTYRIEFVDTAHGAFLTLLLTFVAK